MAFGKAKDLYRLVEILSKIKVEYIIFSQSCKANQ